MRSALILLLIVIIGYATCDTVTIPLKKRTVKKQSNAKNDTKFLSSAQNYVIDNLVNFDQSMYAGDIQVGTNGETFSVDFDTGSNLLWLTSDQCPSCREDGYTNSYKCTNTDGCTLTAKTGEIKYGDGAMVSGLIADVPVSIPGLNSVTESLLLVDKSVDNGNLESDGLFGLGVYNEQNPDSISYVTALFNKGIIKQNLFSFYLGFGKYESQLIFGGYDVSKIADGNQIYYTPVIINQDQKKNDRQRWSLGIKTISLNGLSFDLAQGKNVAIVDSGTSLITMRNDIYNAFMANLNKQFQLKKIEQDGDDFYIVSCGTTLPDLQITMTDTTGVDRIYSLPSTFYVVKDGSTCFIGITPEGEGDVQFILGDTFMRRYVSIFSYTDISVGLALSIAKPIDDDSSSFPKWAIGLIVGGGVLLVLAIGIYIYKQRQKSKKSKNSNLNEQILDQENQQK